MDFTRILPVEICAEIFACLPYRERIRNERVCSTWKSVLLEYAWRETRTLSYDTLEDHGVKNSFRKLFVEEKKMCSIVKRCGRYLRHVYLQDLVIVLPGRLNSCRASFTESCRNLVSLDLGEDAFAPEELEKIGTWCPMLEHFTFYGRFTEDAFASLRRFFGCCQRLKTIGLSSPNFRKASSSDWSLLVASLPKGVTALCLESSSVSEPILITITEKCLNLKSLQLSRLPPDATSSLSDRIFACCKQLTTLTLQSHDRCINRLGRRIGTLSNLKELSLGLMTLAPSGMHAITAGCTKLQCVSLCEVHCEKTDLGSLSLLNDLTCLELINVRHYSIPENSAQKFFSDDQLNFEFESTSIGDELLNRITAGGRLRFLSLEDLQVTSTTVANVLDHNKDMICVVIKDVVPYGLILELCPALVRFVKERRENIGEQFSWPNIQRDISNYLAIDNFRAVFFGKEKEYFYEDFGSFLRSSRRRCSTGFAEDRYAELHVWNTTAEKWTSGTDDPLLRIYNKKDFPYVRCTGLTKISTNPRPTMEFRK